MPKEKEPTTEVINIDDPSKAIKLYKITPAEIAERLKEYDSLKVIKGDPKSYKAVRAVLTALVHTRTEVEKRRLKLGKDYRGLIDKSISNINKASEMLANPMAPYEERFRSELKAEDARVDAIKAEKAAQEQARKDDIQEKIHKIRMATGGINLMDLKSLKEISDELEKIEITEKEYMESTDEAEKALDASYDAVQSAIAARITLDQEEAGRQAEDARLEKIRKKQEDENKKIKAAQKKIDDEKDQLEEKKKQEAFEKAATEKAEAAAAQKVKDDAAKKIEEEKAEEVEKERKEASRPDREKLRAFADYLQEDLKYPELQSMKSLKVLKSARTQIYDIGNEILEALEEL